MEVILVELIDLLNKIENACYSEKYSDVLEDVNGFIEIVSELYLKNPKLLPVLKCMMNAMEKDDYILIGDCLEYGVKPILYKQNFLDSVFNDSLYNIPDIMEDIFYYASYSDEPVLCVKNDRGNTIRLNSLFSPIHEVDKWYSNLQISNQTPVVCQFGLGTGLFSEAVLNRLSKESKLIIYEPNRKILDYCVNSGKTVNCDDSERRISDRIEKIITDERVCLIIESEGKIDFRYELENCLNYIELNCFSVIKHNGYEKLFSNSYLTFLKEINYHRNKMFTNKNTIAFFKDFSIDSIFKNILRWKKINLCDEIKRVLPDDIPAIIVSAGPSLDKNINILSEAKGHCFILAVDTAVKYLMEKNIIPDMIITMDSIKPASYFSDDRTHLIPCIFDVAANPDILKAHKGRIVLYNSSDFYSVSLFKAIGKDLTMYPHGGSVATAAFVFLYMLNQKKIILIGQDLASENGITHAGGINDGSTNKESIVEGYYGGNVTTRSDWLGYLRWFEKSIETIKESNINIQVINATEGGAKIHGANQMTLHEAIESCRDSEGNLPIYNFETQLDKLDYYLSDEEYGDLIKKHFEAIDKLKEIEIRAGEARKICSNLMKGIDEGTVSGSYVDKEKKKISKIIEWCSRTTIFPLLNNYLITDVIDDICRLKFAEGDIKTTEKNGIELMKISFEAIVEASKAIYQKAKEISKEEKNA